MAQLPYEATGPVFTVPFSASAITSAETDLFCVTAPANAKVVIREIRFGQYSDFGDAQAEMLSVTLMTGSTANSGGATITAQNVQQHSGALTAGSSALGPSATVASTASATVRLADTWNVASGWFYKPEPIERLVLNPSQRLVVRISAPNDALTMNGTLVVQEAGYTG